MSFTYDENKALSAGRATFINTSGFYIGKITRAKVINALNSEAKGIEFSFDSDAGKANFKVWTHNKNGEEIFGANFIYAMIGFYGIKKILPIASKEERHDKQSGQDIIEDIKIYKELEREFALCLQAEEYINKNTGKVGINLVLKHVNHPETLKDFVEFKEKKEAKAYLKYDYQDKKIEQQQTSFNNNSGLSVSNTGYSNTSFTDDDLSQYVDDNIPF